MTQMTVKDGKLHLTEIGRGQHVDLPIDVFFKSLAEEAGPQAIGVILSGTGKDGSQGIQDIHSKGGLGDSPVARDGPVWRNAAKRHQHRCS